MAALAAATALAVAACGGGDSTVDSATASAAEAGVPLLSGEFETVAGDTIDLASLENQDVVFWFWAPW